MVQSPAHSPLGLVLKFFFEFESRQDSFMMAVQNLEISNSNFYTKTLIRYLKSYYPYFDEQINLYSRTNTVASLQDDTHRAQSLST